MTLISTGAVATTTHVGSAPGPPHKSANKQIYETSFFSSWGDHTNKTKSKPPKSKIQNLKSKLQNPNPLQDLNPHNQNSKIQTPKIKTPRSKPPQSKLQDPKSKLQHSKSKLQDPKSKLQNPKSKLGELARSKRIPDPRSKVFF